MTKSCVTSVCDLRGSIDQGLFVLGRGAPGCWVVKENAFAGVEKILMTLGSFYFYKQNLMLTSPMVLHNINLSQPAVCESLCPEYLCLIWIPPAPPFSSTESACYVSKFMLSCAFK